MIKSWDTTTDNWQRGIAWATFLYYRCLNVTEIAHGTVALVRRLSVGFLATASRRGTGRLVYWWRRESSRKSITSPPTNGASSSSSCPLSPYVRRSYVRSWDGFENRSRTHQRRHRQRDTQQAAGGGRQWRREKGSVGAWPRVRHTAARMLRRVHHASRYTLVAFLFRSTL